MQLLLYSRRVDGLRRVALDTTRATLSHSPVTEFRASSTLSAPSLSPSHSTACCCCSRLHPNQRQHPVLLTFCTVRRKGCDIRASLDVTRVRLNKSERYKSLIIKLTYFRLNNQVDTRFIWDNASFEPKVPGEI